MLLSEGMFTLKISKELCRDRRTIKKAVKKIIKFRIRIKGKGFKNLLPRDKRKLKRVLTKCLLLTSAQIFKDPGIVGVKKNKKCRILSE